MKLLVTDECGRLARWLRLMGYDASSMTSRPLSVLYRQAYNEGRIIITRNRYVGASGLVRVVQLASTFLEEQLKQLMRDVSLRIDWKKTFTRCDQCNVSIEAVDKSKVAKEVPPYVFKTQQAFHRCPSCRRIYWPATHWQRARRVFERISMETDFVPPVD